MFICAAVTHAPVLPALITASQRMAALTNTTEKVADLGIRGLGEFETKGKRDECVANAKDSTKSANYDGDCAELMAPVEPPKIDQVYEELKAKIEKLMGDLDDLNHEKSRAAAAQCST